MTRWARSGNTQKHCKQPEDATPWEQFAKQERIPKNKKGIFRRKNNDNNQVGKLKNNAATDNHSPEMTLLATGKVPEFKKKNKKFKNETEVQTFIVEPEVDDVKTGDPEAESKNMPVIDVIAPEDSQPILREHEGKGNLQNKRKTFHEQVAENRLQNGIPLLPNNMERKLYKMKKGLRRKGMPEEKIKDMLRHARRNQEVTYRKTFKTCYNCRETGHVLADCPRVKADTDQETGICFKCGSTEHTSYKCQVKTKGFPFAKCFICNEIGHLSRNCPKNTKGVYIKGGQCRSCGEVDHFAKDCPQIKKKDEDEVTVDIVSKFTSVDDEVIQDEAVEAPARKKPKVVKF